MGHQHDWLFQPFAHRGLHAPDRGVIENTFSAFQAALDAGYGIELDVRQAGDGEIVVFHDDTLERLTTSASRVADCSVTQLKKVSFRKSKDRIQTLPELLSQVDARVPLLIEIKTDWMTHGPREKRVADALAGYRGRVAVMSFDPRSIAVFARQAPHITRGMVAETFADQHSKQNLPCWRRFYMRHLLTAFTARPHFINYDVRALPAPAPWFWRSVLRKPLLTWTIRSPQQQEHAMRWADAIVFEHFSPVTGNA